MVKNWAIFIIVRSRNVCSDNSNFNSPYTFLLQFIYQTFYKTSSAHDKGSLCDLRNFVGRIDVHGSEEVIQKYR